MNDTLGMHSSDIRDRLSALETIVRDAKNRNDFPFPRETDANNHIHTTYSFSPYSPTEAIYHAHRAGLPVAGIIDHDSVSGIPEFHQAARIAGIQSTGGVEVRVRFNRGFGTINNPDQKECMYLAAHGLCETQIEPMDRFLAPYRLRREKRTRAMCDRLNALSTDPALIIEYEKDVRSLSLADQGGTVTERHMLFALAGKLESRFGRTPILLGRLESDYGLRLSSKQRGLLTDPDNRFFLYDLLGVLKTDTSPYFIPATDELPEAEDFVRMAQACGAIPAYAYLGDVTESVTQDKRAQSFEDSYLDDLAVALRSIGIPALTYMPTRNTPEQLKRVRELCDRQGFFQISGEDINSPRQKFSCDALALPENRHLIQSTWALIGHEAEIRDKGIEYGLFGSVHATVALSEKIKRFANIGKNMRRI